MYFVHVKNPYILTLKDINKAKLGLHTQKLTFGAKVYAQSVDSSLIWTYFKSLVGFQLSAKIASFYIICIKKSLLVGHSLPPPSLLHLMTSRSLFKGRRRRKTKVETFMCSAGPKILPPYLFSPKIFFCFRMLGNETLQETCNLELQQENPFFFRC